LIPLTARCSADRRAEIGPSHCPAFGAALICLLLIPLGSGCAMVARDIQRGRSAYHLGDFQTAQASLKKAADAKSPAALPARLDLAMAQFASGQTAAAIESLRSLRDDFDNIPAISPAQEVASIVTDDTVRQYRPAGYEQVMVRSMLSLCSLAAGDGDAESYALQAQMHQAELARQAESRGLTGATDVYQPLALAPYLRGVLREATLHDYDDAVRAYQLVSHLQPAFAPAQADIERATNGRHSAPGHGVLYIIALVGRGPVLQEQPAEVTTAALQIATQVYSLAENDRMMLPNLVSVKVPKVVVPHSPAAALSLDSSGVWLGATQPLVDIGQMAARQSEAEMPWTLARAVVRRVTKEVAVTQATRTAGLNGLSGEVARFAGVNVWSLTESADTRCWGLLPREIQVLRAELPAGTHNLGLTVVGNAGQNVGLKSYADVSIENGRNTYLTVIAGDRQAHIAL